MCDRRQCVNVTITDDDVVEETEIVEATLERLPDTDDRIILAPAIAKVVVTDDDGESAYSDSRVYSSYITIIGMHELHG